MKGDNPIHSYDKHDATMTRGYAILSMCLLHLFCCLGSDVKGMPIIWISPEKPLVYFFGFFAEICVPTYSICVGYGQTLMEEEGRLNLGNNIRRIKRLMINYWIILGIFSIVGILAHKVDIIPQNFPNFLKSIVLLHSYNGAWWFLNTYVILLFLPKLFQEPVRKVNPFIGIIICLAIDFLWYLLTRFNLIPEQFAHPVVGFTYKEVYNLISVLPYYWIGGYLCKMKLVRQLSMWMNKNLSYKRQNLLLGSIFFIMFVTVNLLSKAVLIGPCAVITFLIFNLLNKAGWIEKVFNFLGVHSTNIWLTHMFFYAYTFPGLVQSARLPVLMLLFLLTLCIGVSYLEKGIERIIIKT